MEPLQFSAQILKVESKVDRTLNVRMNTQELPKDEAGTLYDLSGKQVWVAMSETEISNSDIDIPDFVPEFKGEKSHSQKVKELLWLLWDQKSDKKKTAGQFYNDYMENFENMLKDKLN